MNCAFPCLAIFMTVHLQTKQNSNIYWCLKPISFIELFQHISFLFFFNQSINNNNTDKAVKSQINDSVFKTWCLCPFSHWFSFHASRSSIKCLDQETVRSHYFVIHLPNHFLASNKKQLSHVTEIIPKFSYYQQSNLRETQLPNNVIHLKWHEKRKLITFSWPIGHKL